MAPLLPWIHMHVGNMGWKYGGFKGEIRGWLVTLTLHIGAGIVGRGIVCGENEVIGIVGAAFVEAKFKL